MKNALLNCRPDLGLRGGIERNKSGLERRRKRRESAEARRDSIASGWLAALDGALAGKHELSHGWPFLGRNRPRAWVWFRNYPRCAGYLRGVSTAPAKQKPAAKAERENARDEQINEAARVITGTTFS